ncbi:MAG: hypothetical protein ABWY11_20615 [Umezawaea sp.]
MAMALFGVGLVFASAALGHQLESWAGPARTDAGHGLAPRLAESGRHLAELMRGGAVTTVVVLALASPFIALRRHWAAVVTTCLAAVSVPMAILFGVLQPGSRHDGKPYSDSDWASFCSATAAPLIVIGAIGTLTSLYLRGRREGRARTSEPVPERI